MNKFELGTKNAEIFQTTTPYNNHSQGSAPRWLFVCSAGLLRSPTGAALAIRKGLNARSCGSAIDYALIPVSANLIMWAEKIVFIDGLPGCGKTLFSSLVTASGQNIANWENI